MVEISTRIRVFDSTLARYLRAMEAQPRDPDQCDRAESAFVAAIHAMEALNLNLKEAQGCRWKARLTQALTHVNRATRIDHDKESA